MFVINSTPLILSQCFDLGFKVYMATLIVISLDQT
jgi:hypothetical protein